MLHRVRLVTDSGTVNESSRVLQTRDLSLTLVENSTPRLSFKVSRDDFSPTVFPFVVRVEYAIPGGDQVARFQPIPEHDLFIVLEDEDDSGDAAKIVTYTAEGFVPWLLGGALVPWSASSKNGKRRWVEPGNRPASAGYTLHGMLTESKNAGWFPSLMWDFNGTNDSNGLPWASADKSVIEWELSKPYTHVLNSLVNDGMCDWSASGMTLRLFRPGMKGVDRPNVVLGGPEFTKIPVKTDATGLYSHIRAAPDGLPWQNYASNMSISSRFGHRQIFLSQSGIKDVASSARHAAPYIEAGKQVAREEAYEWTPSEGGVSPWADFVVGDSVSARSRGGKQLRRVVGLIVRQGTADSTVQVRVGDVLKSRAARVKDRLNSVSVGGNVGGSGASFPASSGPAPFAPDRPDGLVVSSNVGEYRPDFTAVSSVELAWSAVTSAVDGSECDVVEYELWSRLPNEALSLVTSVTASASPSVVVSSWAPGLLRLVAVRARDTGGRWSEFSLEVPVTPAMPASVVPAAPSNLRVVSNTGQFTPTGPNALVVLAWDEVTMSTDSEPLEATEYELWNGSGPLLRLDALTTTVTIPSGVDAEFRVRAVTAQGVWGDLSVPVEVTGGVPTMATFSPSAPVLTTGYGVVSVVWDGTYTSTPTGGHTVWVEARIGGSDWVQQGTALAGAGSALVRLGSVGDTLDVRLVSYDQLGRQTGVSDTEQIVIEAIDGEDILANSIHANRMVLGELSVDHLEPNVGENLNISANAVVIDLNDRGDQTDIDVAALGDLVEDVQTTAEEAAESAADAQSAVDALATGRMLSAEGNIAALSDKLDQYDNSFSFESDGLHIREANGAEAEMVLTSAGARLIADGVVASEWNQGQLIVAQIVVGGGRIGNHTIDSSILGHTTFRPFNP